MRINIAASHRFHLLDLARELERQGHEVKFYSYVPSKRAANYGLKKKNSKSLFFLMLPFLAFFKISKGSFLSRKILNLALDYYLTWYMEPCDVFIALGTVYKKSFLTAKKNFGAITILEWGSKHIIDQQDILSKIPNVKKQPSYFTKRSIDGYVIADYISIPSKHVMESFLNHGICEKKLLKNPYGVDLSMFHATSLNKNDSYDLLMVGSWSYQKGCDLVAELCKQYNYSLLHVGSLVDVPFPDHPNMCHVDSVDQKELINFYSKAKVFLLPSRQDGFGMVLSQALVCGLPIVCSKNTGGYDLKEFLQNQEWIIEMKKFDLAELWRCVDEALALSQTQKKERSYSNKELLTWEAYGKRYKKNLDMLIYDRRN